jgi:hypothetical protein
MVDAVSKVTFTAWSSGKNLNMESDKITGCRGGSGIVGQVIIGPLMGVERPGMTNYRPYQATIAVVSEHGKTVAEFKSDVNGRFQVPGDYPPLENIKKKLRQSVG